MRQLQRARLDPFRDLGGETRASCCLSGAEERCKGEHLSPLLTGWERTRRACYADPRDQGVWCLGHEIKRDSDESAWRCHDPRGSSFRQGQDMGESSEKPLAICDGDRLYT